MLRKQKWIHLTGCVTAVSYCTIFGCTSNMEILWKLFVLVNEISAKKKKRGVFYILLYIFLHLRTNFGGPFSALVTRIENFVCLVCSHYYSNVNDSVASTSFSKSLKSRQNALHGQVMLCCAALLSKGRFVGFPFPSWAVQLPPGALGAGLEGNYFMWMKERQYSSDVNCKWISLAWGVPFFTGPATDKFSIGN